MPHLPAIGFYISISHAGDTAISPLSKTGDIVLNLHIFKPEAFTFAAFQIPPLLCGSPHKVTEFQYLWIQILPAAKVKLFPGIVFKVEELGFTQIPALVFNQLIFSIFDTADFIAIDGEQDLPGLIFRIMNHLFKTDSVKSLRFINTKHVTKRWEQVHQINIAVSPGILFNSRSAHDERYPDAVLIAALFAK